MKSEIVVRIKEFIEEKKQAEGIRNEVIREEVCNNLSVPISNTSEKNGNFKWPRKESEVKTYGPSIHSKSVNTNISDESFSCITKQCCKCNVSEVCKCSSFIPSGKGLGKHGAFSIQKW